MGAVRPHHQAAFGPPAVGEHRRRRVPVLLDVDDLGAHPDHPVAEELGRDQL